MPPVVPDTCRLTSTFAPRSTQRTSPSDYCIASCARRHVRTDTALFYYRTRSWARVRTSRVQDRLTRPEAPSRMLHESASLPAPCGAALTRPALSAACPACVERIPHGWPSMPPPQRVAAHCPAGRRRCRDPARRRLGYKLPTGFPLTGRMAHHDIRLVGSIGELDLVGGVLGRTGVRRQAHGQMSSVGANSTGVLQIRSDVSDARSRAPRVLRAVQAHTPTSRQSGDVNSNMLFTASAVRSTCGSGGSPHAGSKNDRQRQYRSDRSEPAVRVTGQGAGAAHVFNQPYL